MTGTPPCSLLVDLYELTMAAAFWQAEMATKHATFSLFVRRLPRARGYLVAAGLDDVLSWLEELRFETADLDVLADLGLFSDDVLARLQALRFTGTVRAVPEGTVVFADEPILEVDAPLVEAQLAETFLLNQVSLQTTLATKAARCRDAAAGRGVVDFALRRSQGIDAGMKLARVSRLIGLDGTSNVAGSWRYGLRASGTMAHSFVQAFPSESEAFRAFARCFGPSTILLVDTYDTLQGVAHAIQVATELRALGTEIAGIRLDSGDLVALARDARRMLDGAGFPGVRIIASGGLDEYEIERVLAAGAPIDAFGVGTSLGVSDDAPGLDAVYKLVALDGRPVRKTSARKAIWPGPKQVWRAPSFGGDVLALAHEPAPTPDHQPLLEPVMADGDRTDAGRRDLAQAHEWFATQWAELPEAVRRLRRPARYRVQPSRELRAVTRAVDREIRAHETGGVPPA